MSVKLAYVATDEPITRFQELDCVRLRTAVQSIEGKWIEAGRRGAIVSVLNGGSLYDVEFVEPEHGLAMVKAEDLDGDPAA